MRPIAILAAATLAACTQPGADNGGNAAADAMIVNESAPPEAEANAVVVADAKRGEPARPKRRPAGSGQRYWRGPMRSGQISVAGGQEEIGDPAQARRRDLAGGVQFLPGDDGLQPDAAQHLLRHQDRDDRKRAVRVITGRGRG